MVTENNPESYGGQYGGFDYEFKKKEWESIHEFCAAINTTVGNTF